MTEEQSKEKLSFIAEARREQMLEAAIRTLDEIGYVKTSLSQIAKRAGISTALISYHFSDKTDLMNFVLTKLAERSTSFVLERVRKETTAQAKLNAFIAASLDYQRTHPAHYTALVEIVFNARTPDNIPYYKLNDEDEDDALKRELLQILRDGQSSGEFGPFHPEVMASLIRGAIDEYTLTFGDTKKLDPETYCRELVELVSRAVKAESKK